MSLTYDLAGILQEIRTRIQDTDNKLDDPTELEQFVEDGINRYTSDRPLIVATSAVAPGTKVLPLPTTFIKRFSSVQEIEYPIGNVPRRLLDDRNWNVIEWLDEIHTDDFTIPAGQSYRVVHTARHTIKDYPTVASPEQPTATATTIPVTDFTAITIFSSSRAARAIAARYANTSESTLGADITNYRSKAQEYSSLADDLIEEYERLMHPGEGQQSGTVVDVNFDLDTQVGVDMMFHRRRFR